MKIAVTHRLDDTYIEKAWKHAEMEEIEDLAAGLLGKAQEAQSIEEVDRFSDRCPNGRIRNGNPPRWLLCCSRSELKAKPISARDICATRPRSVLRRVRQQLAQSRRRDLSLFAVGIGGIADVLLWRLINSS